jgi:hypothetical protein
MWTGTDTVSPQSWSGPREEPAKSSAHTPPTNRQIEGPPPPARQPRVARGERLDAKVFRFGAVSQRLNHEIHKAENPRPNEIRELAFLFSTSNHTIRQQSQSALNRVQIITLRSILYSVSMDRGVTQIPLRGKFRLVEEPRLPRVSRGRRVFRGSIFSDGSRFSGRIFSVRLIRRRAEI